MRIEKEQKIGGVSALDVRRLLRRYAHVAFSPGNAAEFLEISPRAASRLLTKLRSDGYLESSASGDYERTLKGSALAGASSSSPLRTATAQRIVSDVVRRAMEINATEPFAFRVTRLELFGSVLSGKDRPSDVDIAYRLEPRWSGDAQLRAARERIVVARRAGRKFPTMIDELVWPQTEVLRALRGRSRGLSLSRLETIEDIGAARRVVFGA